MNMDWIISSIPIVLLLPLLIYAAFVISRPKVPLYFQITFYAGACALLEFLYENIVLLCNVNSELTNLGGLAVGGCCAFFFAANYGHFDSIVDGGQACYRKERLLAWIAPVISGATLLWATVYSGYMEPLYLIIVIVNTVAILPCSYFNMKFILMKDDGTGFIKGVKPLNIASLAYIMLQWGYTLTALLEFDTEILDITNYILEIIAIGAMFIFSVRGRKKWMSL